MLRGAEKQIISLKLRQVSNFKHKVIFVGWVLCIILSLSPANLFAGEAVITWNAPVSNADGTPLTDLAGFKIYYGTISGIYTDNIDVGRVTTSRISNLTDGLIYYFVVTAYDFAGNESGYSNEISRDIITSNNNPPSVAQLVFPLNYQEDLGATVEFRWDKSEDLDGDMVAYDLYVCEDENFITSCIVESDIAGLLNNDIVYAGISSSEIELLMFALVATLAGIVIKRDRVFSLLAVTVTAGIILISCGGGGGGGGSGSGVATSVNDDRGSDEVTMTVSGLKTGTVYYWKVVAKDYNGGVTDSSVWSFDTR